jgi:hypothetical protein
MINALIQKLKKEKVYISLEDGKLKLSFDGEISDILLLEIKSNKELLINYLNSFNSPFNSIKTIEKAFNHPLSSAQKRLWVLSKFDEIRNVYNVFHCLKIKGSLNVSLFENAYQQIIERHTILRTVFNNNGAGVPYQSILESTDKRFKLKFVDYSSFSSQHKKQIIDQYVEDEVLNGFNLELGPLIRCSLLKENEQEYIWILVMHHIIIDGWSMDILYKEWGELYNAAIEDRLPNVTQLGIQYIDYAAWQNTQLKSNNIKVHKEYWLEQFKGELPILEIPIDKPRPKVMTYQGANLYRELDEATTKKLKMFGQQQGGTLFITLQTALNILLYKYTGQVDIVIGSPISGREHPDLHEQIGFYVNMLAFRNRFSINDTLGRLYQKIKKNTLEAYSHQLYPYDELVDELNLIRDVSRNPLFDVALSLLSVEESKIGLEFINTEIELFNLKRTEFEVAKFDLSFSFEDCSDKILFSLNYNTNIYSETQANLIINNLYYLLKSLSYISEKKIKEINLIN